MSWRERSRSSTSRASPRMSERLAQKGKLGAEEVTDVMNLTFSRLLDVAYARRRGAAQVRRRRPPALLHGRGPRARGPATPPTACARRCASSGGPRPPPAPVTLRMHVGVHSDTFDFFLVGDSHRELLLTGPGRDQTVEMEGGAEAGEILVSDETAAALPDRLFGDEKEGGRLLKAPPGTGGELDAAPSARGPRPRRLRPAADPPASRGRQGRARAPAGLGRLRALRRRGRPPRRERGADELADALDELVTTAQRVA